MSLVLRQYVSSHHILCTARHSLFKKMYMLKRFQPMKRG